MWLLVVVIICNPPVGNYKNQHYHELKTLLYAYASKQNVRSYYS